MPIRYSTFTSIVPHLDPRDWERKRRLPPDATMHEAEDWSDFVLAMARMGSEWPADDTSKKYYASCVSPALYRSPNIAREDGNVVGWGAFMGIDLDSGDITLDEVQACFTEMGLNHLIYSTTKCTPEHWRLRVLFPISRELTCDEVPTAWRAMIRHMAPFKPDTTCKDLSRLYVAPMVWLPSTAHPSKAPNANPVTAFEYGDDLGSFDIDDCMARYPEPCVPPENATPQKIVCTALQRGFVRSGGRSPASKRLPRGHNIFDSPVVTPKAVADYLALGPGEHHTGLFAFMCSVIRVAQIKNIPLSIGDVVGYVEEIDRASSFPRDHKRMANIGKEVERAFRYCN